MTLRLVVRCFHSRNCGEREEQQHKTMSRICMQTTNTFHTRRRAHAAAAIILPFSTCASNQSRSEHIVVDNTTNYINTSRNEKKRRKTTTTTTSTSITSRHTSPKNAVISASMRGVSERKRALSIGNKRPLCRSSLSTSLHN